MRTNNDRKMISIIREKDKGDRFYICLSILMGFLLFIPIFCLFVPRYVPPRTNKRFFQHTLTASASIHDFTAPVSSSKSPLSIVSISDFSSFVVSFWEKLGTGSQIKLKTYDERSRVLMVGPTAQFGARCAGFSVSRQHYYYYCSEPCVHDKTTNGTIERYLFRSWSIGRPSNCKDRFLQWCHKNY